MRLTGEDRLIDWLRRVAPGGEHLGDDVALLDGTTPLAVSVDQQIEGVHFPPGLDPAWIARRLLEIGLSDLAAAGAVPRYAFLALAAPRSWEHRRFLDAFATACRARGVDLVGGDTAGTEYVHLTIVVLGSRTPRGRFLRRSDARPGDGLWIGGPVGLSAIGRRLAQRGSVPHGRALGLAPEYSSPPSLARAARRALRVHFAPRAQLDLGSWLARRRRAAAMDVSDGLSLDLARLCSASGVGARLDPALLTLDPPTTRLAEGLGASPRGLVLTGGEDYVLLFSLPPRSTPPGRLRCRRIGKVTESAELRVEGEQRALEPGGWSHLDAPSQA